MIGPLSANKALGQHFLKDDNYCRRIVRFASITSGDKVLEIGPGTGLLTAQLLEAGAQVTAVEFDRRMVDFLTNEWSHRQHPFLEIVAGDILNLTLAEILDDYSWKAVGNLPYNISTRVIRRMIESKERFHSLTFLLQKEVTLRICAAAGTRDYGAFSVLMQHHFKVRPGFDIPPGAFIPPPKVVSRLLRLKPTPIPGEPSGWRSLELLLHRSFAHRRKTLVNNLKRAGYPVDKLRTALQKCEAGERSRAQDLTLEQFLCLRQVLESRE